MCRRQDRWAWAKAGSSDLPRCVERRPFASGLLAPGWTRAHVVLVAIGATSILFDGLSQTQAWFDLFGVPGLPLATVLLVAFLGLVVGLALAVGRLVGLAAVGAGRGSCRSPSAISSLPT